MSSTIKLVFSPSTPEKIYMIQRLQYCNHLMLNHSPTISFLKQLFLLGIPRQMIELSIPVFKKIDLAFRVYMEMVSFHTK